MTGAFYHSRSPPNALKFESSQRENLPVTLPRLSLADMILHFGVTYRTIDIRTVAIRSEAIWKNVYTVIRFTYEAPAEAERRVRKLEQVYGTVRTKSFRVTLDARPFSDWSRIQKQLESDKLRVGNTGVTFQQPVWGQLKTMLQYLGNDYSVVRPFDSYEWPVTQFSLHGYGTPALPTESLVRETTKIGFPDPYEAVNLLCELNLQFNQSQGHQLYLSMPVFASIEQVRILSRENKIHIAARKHVELESVKCVALLRERDHRRSEPWKRRLAVEISATERTSIVTAIGSASLPESATGEHDIIEVQLLHPELGPISQFTNSVRQLIPQAQRNILFEALQFFCNKTEFENSLVRPFDKRGPRLKESAAFELRVAWLMSLLGLSTIVLGEYEDIVAPNTKVRRGTADLLAAAQNPPELIIVACTIGPPKDEDFTRLRTTAEILGREVFSETSVRIHGLICTAAPGYAAPADAGIAVLDADRLSLALRLIEKGRERNVLAFIESPMFQELRDPEY